MNGGLASTLNRMATGGDWFGIKNPNPATGDKPASASQPTMKPLASQFDAMSKPFASGFNPDAPWSAIKSSRSLTQQNTALAPSMLGMDRPSLPAFGDISTKLPRSILPFGNAFGPALGQPSASAMGSSPMSRMMGQSPMQVPMGPGTSVAQPGTTPTSGVASLGGEWAKIDSLNTYITEAAKLAGIDPNLIKAVMKLESGGEWIISHAGAIGYMQVVPKYWGHLGYNLNDPRENIIAGAMVLKYYLDQNGGNVYEALRGYHGYGHDGFTTDQQYADIVTGNLETLRAAGGTGGGGYVGTGSGWSVMFGGKSYPITQEMGLNSFSRQHLNGMYSYATAYGVTGHAGIDVGMTYGSSVYSPTGGTVIRAGGTGYYCDDSGCGPGKGELKIKLDNGHELIIGHMSNISVQVGQRVNAGMFVGKSGSAGTGAHIHVEYRRPDSGTSAGWRAIDPRQALNGNVTATGGGGTGVGGTGSQLGATSGLQSAINRAMGLR